MEAGGGGGGGGRGDEAGAAAGVVVGGLELRPPELRFATVGGDAWLTALAEASAGVPLVNVCAAELLAGGRGVPGTRWRRGVGAAVVRPDAGARLRAFRVETALAPAAARSGLCAPPTGGPAVGRAT